MPSKLSGTNFHLFSNVVGTGIAGWSRTTDWLMYETQDGVWINVSAFRENYKRNISSLDPGPIITLS
jgi:hypothetical protein